MSAGDSAARLSELPLFSGVSDAELASAAGLVSEERDAGEYIFRQGDLGDALYVVRAGQVVLENHLDGRTRALAICGPGDWFGELALLSGGPRTADARVTVHATLLRITRAAWMQLALHAPQLFARLCERLSLQLRATNEPPRPIRHVVAGCVPPRNGIAPWIEDLQRSLRRQFPARDVQILDVGPGTEEALARIVARDAIVLLAERADRVTDCVVERVGPSEWVIERPSGSRGPEVVRGASPAGALDRVARLLGGARIGLALGAGGAYGFAHLGLVRALERAGIPIDCVAGASMGAIVGACIAAGASAERLITFARDASARFRSIVLWDLDLRGPSLLRGKGVMALLAELAELRDATFEGLLLPFVAVAMDLATGEEAVIDSGPLLAGIAPSFAMPGIFPPAVLDGRTMVDGAMVNPVPVDRARQLGADFVIAAQPIPALQPATDDPVGGLLGYARRAAKLLPLWRLPQTIETLDVSVRSFQSLWFRLARASALSADAIVCPDLQQFWFLGFGSAGPIIEVGERAAEVALPGLRRALKDQLGWDGAVLSSGSLVD